MKVEDIVITNQKLKDVFDKLVIELGTVIKDKLRQEMKDALLEEVREELKEEIRYFVDGL